MDSLCILGGWVKLVGENGWKLLVSDGLII